MQVHAGDICRLQVDAIVSPANSFGFMDTQRARLELNPAEIFLWD